MRAAAIFRAAALGLVMLAGPVMAVEPLAEDQHVVNSLVAGRIGDVIRKNCPTIEARMFRVMSGISELKRHALAKGHDEAEIRAFLKDPVQKKRMKDMAARWLQRAGAIEGDAESFCRVGRSEIARNTLVGSLLRDRG